MISDLIWISGLMAVFSRKKTFLREQRLQKKPFFSSGHLIRSKLKVVILILIFNSNSSVFIYLAHNGQFLLLNFESRFS